MRITYRLLAVALLVIVAATPPCMGRAATATDDGGAGQNPSASAAPSAAPRGSGGGETAATEAAAPPLRVWLVLASGTKVEADEVSEKPDGFWFRRGNMWTMLDRAKVARVERESPPEEAAAGAETKAAPARWSLSDSARVESFFVKRFGRTLPVTAFGQSGLHSRWGYDHRLSMDVGLHPDSHEGRALMAFLSAEGLPFMSFRRAIPGVASAPHIHIGLPSRRLGAR